MGTGQGRCKQVLFFFFFFLGGGGGGGGGGELDRTLEDQRVVSEDERKVTRNRYQT